MMSMLATYGYRHGTSGDLVKTKHRNLSPSRAPHIQHRNYLIRP
jgi:hypothetical protein